VLIAELCADAPGAVGDVVQLYDPDRIAPRDLDRPIARPAVRQNHLAIDGRERRERALDRGRDVALLVEGLDDDADSGIHGLLGARPLTCEQPDFPTANELPDRRHRACSAASTACRRKRDGCAAARADSSHAPETAHPAAW